MATRSLKTLGRFIQPSRFDKGTGALLPDAYKKFWKEWKLSTPAAVHYIEEEGRYKRDPVTGEVHPVQNIPLPLLFPKESHEHIWGGEGVIQGFTKKNRRRRVPHFWMPQLKRSVVYSEVLDKYISVIVTERTINLINSNYGFDHYLLKTPACDLKSLLCLGLKRKILQELEKGCPTYADRPESQKSVIKKYQPYLAAYTSEEIEWYGYSFTEACKKIEEEIEEQNKPVALKHVYRSQLIAKLKEPQSQDSTESVSVKETTSWLQKVNIFSKKQET